MSEVLRAGVQYGDWEGTAAADSADVREFSDLLEKKGLLDRNVEFLVAVDVYIGENHGGKVQAPIISALLAEGNKYDDVATSLRRADPLKLKQVDVDLTLEEFLGLFKRFNIVLTRRGLELTGRSYEP